MTVKYLFVTTLNKISFLKAQKNSARYKNCYMGLARETEFIFLDISVNKRIRSLNIYSLREKLTFTFDLCLQTLFGCSKNYLSGNVLSIIILSYMNCILYRNFRTFVLDLQLTITVFGSTVQKVRYS